MILTIYSKNSYLADILHKNPNTDEGLYLKPLKEGTVVGNAVSAHQYDIIFWDNGNSYTEEIGDQLDFQSLCNPLIILNISTELFSHILKEKSEYKEQELTWLEKTRSDIDIETCIIEVPVFYINSSWYRNGVFLLEKYFKGIKVRHNVGNNFSLTITSESVFDAINLLNLTALFVHLTNVDAFSTFIDDSFALKYLRVLTNIEFVPYFVHYLFIKRAIKNRTQFEMIKPVLENYLKRYGIDANLTNEDTQQSRLGFIIEKIGVDLAVLDIGCGEFAYYKRLMNKGLERNYYAVDKDEKLKRLGENITNRLDADNLRFYDKLDIVPREEKVNIIISEVIEHNELTESIKLIKTAMDFDFNKIVISTPNAEFNRFYFDEGFRHDDHHFEFTSEEFCQFIENCTAERKDLQIVYAHVGDELNNIRPTQIAVIEKI